MLALKVTNVGNSTGIILPKQALEHLKVAKGDTVYLTESAEGYVLTGYSADFSEAMTEAETFMRQNRHTLRELSKK